MLEKVIKAITTAYQRDHKDVEEENIVVEADEEHKELRMFIRKTVVDEEDYVDPFNEMSLEEAKALSARYEIGDVVNIPVDKMEFGRIAAGNGKSPASLWRRACTSRSTWWTCATPPGGPRC